MLYVASEYRLPPTKKKYTVCSHFYHPGLVGPCMLGNEATIVGLTNNITFSLSLESLEASTSNKNLAYWSSVWATWNCNPIHKILITLFLHMN